LISTPTHAYREGQTEREIERERETERDFAFKDMRATNLLVHVIGLAVRNADC